MAAKKKPCNWSLKELSKKNSKWAEVTELINAVGVNSRSVEQIKNIWRNLQ